MNAAVLVCALTAGHPEPRCVERVEINHCYNRETGDRKFVQVIYWDYVDGSCLHVVDWHMADQAQAIFFVPERLFPATVIRQKNTGAMEVIRARRLVTTHTTSDPEEDDRAVLPIEQRPKKD